MDYVQPTGGNPDDPYIGKNVTAGIQGSKVPPHAVEHPMREIVALIKAARLTPDSANLNQLWQGLLRSITFADTGTANHLVIPLPSGTTFPSGAVGLGTSFMVKALHDITGATDFAPFGLSAAPVTHLDGTALVAGDMIAGGIYLLVNDGAGNYQLVSRQKNAFSISTVSFTTAGAWTWTVPTGVSGGRFYANGGGGGGGGVAFPGAGSGGGGGAFGFISSPLSPAQVISGNIGAAGGAGTSGSDGGAGGATTVIINGVTYTAGGGAGGHSANNTAQNSVSGGAVSGAWQRPQQGQPSFGGVAGFQTGPAILFYAGQGGLSGNGGFGGQAGTGAGNAGGAPGGGGGGSAAQTGGANTNGGAGAAGQVLIEYF